MDGCRYARAAAKLTGGIVDMSTYLLSFGEASILQDNIIEIIVNEDVEIGLDMVSEFQELVKNQLKTPCAILMNKVNAYSYAFEAFECIACMESLKLVAVVSYSKTSDAISSYLIGRLNETNTDVEIFSDRESALSWLQTELS